MSDPVALIRALIAQGCDDDEIYEVLAEVAAEELAGEEADSIYGNPDDDSYGSRPEETDEFYARNDAGEYLYH